MKRVFISLLCSGMLGAATLPSGFSEVQLVSGFVFPSAMEFAPDGRLFVCEKAGKLRVIKNGTLLAAPFVTLQVNELGERGLLGIALDPNFAANQYVYVYYTATTPSVHNRVSRFTAAGDVAVVNSELVLLDLEPLNSANHNGGAIHFSTDGMLYVGVGENAVGSNSQTMTNRLGKMLRIAPDGSIPTNNPFYNSASGVNRSILALGLRNPFTFAVQPGTGRIFINDVGGTSWEEINEGIAGSNYGWPNTEGSTTNPAYRSPLYTYPHSGGPVNGCAITGGTFYNPPVTQFPSSYVGKYFFADLCGWIKYLNPTDGTVTGFATNVNNVVDLKTGADGMLYYLSMGDGAVYRVQATTSQSPVISTHPTSMTVGVGQSATFTVTASGAAPLNYQWQRNGAPIAGANASSYTLANPQLGDSGAQFRCVVSNTFGSVTSNTATLTVTSNQPPTANILTPAAGSLYNAGQAISYSGSATDPDGGSFPTSAYHWQVDFHHDTHTHPFLANLTGASGSFTIPNNGETATNVWYRIYLTVTDSGGLSHTTFRDIQPRLQTFQMLTSPAGLQLRLDDQPIATPASVSSVVGMIRTLGVVSPQTSGGNTYSFVRWNDGGAATHTIVTPASPTSYGATFSQTSGAGFTLSATPASVTVTAGGTATYAVSSTPSGGFSGNVNLSASGLPAGTTATFSVNPIGPSGSSSLSARTSASTPSGTYTLTITGSEAGGTLVSTTTVTLVVNSTAPPNFTLSANPTSQTISPGEVATYTISVTPTNGFSSPVALSASVPPSVASFSPTSATSPGYTSVLTITPPPGTQNADLNLTVTGTGGGLTRTTVVNLRIEP